MPLNILAWHQTQGRLGTTRIYNCFHHNSKLSRFLTLRNCETKTENHFAKKSDKGETSISRWQDMNSSNPLKNTPPHYRWKNLTQLPSPEPEAPKESMPMCKPSFFHTKSGPWTELTFWWCFFSAKGLERNHISHSIQQKESMNFWQKVLNLGWFPYQNHGFLGDLVWGRYNFCPDDWFASTAVGGFNMFQNSFEKKYPNWIHFAENI